MSIRTGLYRDILAGVLKLATERGSILPSWFFNVENDIIHPTCSRSSHVLDGEWWTALTNQVVTLNLTISPVVRIEDEYIVLFLSENAFSVVRSNGGRKSAVAEPDKWYDIACGILLHKDRFAIQVVATIQPSVDGSTAHRELSNVNYSLFRV